MTTRGHTRNYTTLTDATLECIRKSVQTRILRLARHIQYVAVTPIVVTEDGRLKVLNKGLPADMANDLRAWINTPEIMAAARDRHHAETNPAIQASAPRAAIPSVPSPSAIRPTIDIAFEQALRAYDSNKRSRH